MLKIFKYCFYDLMRSRWSIVYALFYLVLAASLLTLSNNLSNAMISLMNVVLILVPLIATVFSVMYYYNSLDFIELLLAQPVRRTSIFLGLYLGIGVSLTISLLVGLGIPFLFYGLLQSGEIFNFLTLIVTGVFLSLIFSGIAFFIALKNDNKVKGFGLAILSWLFFAVIYDGIFLLLMFLYKDYPLESLALTLSMGNPIDLSRILMLLKLDISALMGATGAIFQKFLGTGLGISTAFGLLLLWTGIPILGIKKIANSKDF